MQGIGVTGGQGFESALEFQYASFFLHGNCYGVLVHFGQRTYLVEQFSFPWRIGARSAHVVRWPKLRAITD
ncbi:hypothetical protein D3C76_1744970 [compost metagenome]